MARPVPDRRVQRTRALLQQALLDLMIERGYEATTVQHIIDRANVGRATFYAHFADKETLLASRLEDLRALLVARQAASRERLGFSLAMFEHAHAHRRLYRSLVGRASGARVLQRIHRMVADLAAEDLAAGPVRAADQRELAAEFVAGAFMGVLTWWMERGGTQAPQVVDDTFRRLVLRGMAAEFQLRTLGG